MCPTLRSICSTAFLFCLGYAGSLNAQTLNELPVNLARTELVEFASDFEGSREAFVETIKMSQLLELRNGMVEFKEGSKGIFVFGGDATDRGSNNRWILSQLSYLSQKYPNRFVQIVGNRDVMKLNFSQRIARLEAPLSEKALALYQEWSATEAIAGESERINRARFISNGLLDGWKAEMPAATTFEQALNDLVNAANPGGLLYDNLVRSRVAVRIGDLVFVHGGISGANYLLLPDGSRASSLNAWIAEIESQRAKAVALWTQGGVSALPAKNVFSLVWGSDRSQLAPFQERYTVAGNPYLPEQSVIDSLRSEGITRIAVGHTPQGERIAPVRTLDASFQVFNADTSGKHTPSLLRFDLQGTSIEHNHNGQFSTDRLNVGEQTSRLGLYTEAGFLIKGFDRNKGLVILSRTGQNFVEEIVTVPESKLGRLFPANLSLCNLLHKSQG